MSLSSEWCLPISCALSSASDRKSLKHPTWEFGQLPGNGDSEKGKAETSGECREKTVSLLILIIHAVIRIDCQSRLVGVSWKPDQSKITFPFLTFERFHSSAWKAILVWDISYQNLSNQILFNLATRTHVFFWIPSRIPLSLSGILKTGQREEKEDTFAHLPPAWNGDWCLELEKPSWSHETEASLKMVYDKEGKNLDTLTTPRALLPPWTPPSSILPMTWGSRHCYWVSCYMQLNTFLTYGKSIPKARDTCHWITSRGEKSQVVLCGGLKTLTPIMRKNPFNPSDYIGNTSLTPPICSASF